MKILFKSSYFSHRHEHVQNDEQENHLLNENPVVANESIYDNNDPLSTSEIKEEVLSSDVIIKQNNENETTPVINEYDLLNNELDLRYL